jgi:hypothetical protein
MTTRALKSRVVLVMLRSELSVHPVGDKRQSLLFIVLHFLEFGVNHIIATSGFSLRAARG